MTQHPSVYAGSVIRVTFRFIDPDTGAGAVVAGPVVASYRHQDASMSTTFVVSALSAGVYRGVFPVPEPGRYAAKCVTGGIEPAVAYDEVMILPSPI